MQIYKKYIVLALVLILTMCVWFGIVPRNLISLGVNLLLILILLYTGFSFCRLYNSSDSDNSNSFIYNKMKEIKGLNFKLEEEVATRTFELVNKNNELQYKNIELYRLANLDELTGLPNRRNFLDLLNELILTSDIHQKFAVLLIDLDRFKSINDLYSHDLGDKLIMAVGERLASIAESVDYIARLGGDEFGLLIEKFNNETEVITKAKKILSNFETDFEIDGIKISTTVSIGISIFPDNGESRSELMKNTDIALHTAKKAGKNRIRIYTKEMKANEIRRLNIENKLNSIVKNEEAYLLFQPIYSFSNNKVSGFEALIRWNSKKLGFVSPAEFIPIAEETGHIIEIGDFVLNEACYAIKAINERFNSNYKISINISPKQFLAGNLIDKVAEKLSEGINPSWLDFEITEGCALLDEELTYKNLIKLKAMGISISIDDYGVGYSSLSYLIKYPIDTLKIDRSLVEDIQDNINNFKIIKGIISMCKELNLNVVSEGIETKEQSFVLKSLGCSHGQGFLMSKPIPFEDILEYISNEK